MDTDNAEIHILEDEAASREYFSQLWAEIMTIYRTGEYKLTLSPNMQEELCVIQKKYMPEAPMENAIGEIMNQSFKTEYRKISTHNFRQYGVQRAWVRIVTPATEGFMSIPPDLEKELPFK